MAYDSEEDFLASEVDTSKGWTPESDYEAPKNDARLNIIKNMSPVQQGIDTAAYAQRRATNAMKQAWHKVRGNTKEADDIQKIIDHEDKIYKNYFRSEFNPHRTAAAVGNIAGGVTHPVSMATMPLGGGLSLGARAAVQGGIGGAYEALTNPGGAGDRLSAAALGGVGGAAGSVGSDLVAKGVSGLRRNWDDPVAFAADQLSKRYGTRPGVGQLREYSGRQLTPDQLKQRGQNLPNILEKHATFSQDVDARKLKAALGQNIDPKLSTAYPIGDAKQLSETLSKETKAMWQPFNTLAGKNNNKVFPRELHKALQNLGAENSKLLSDSSAIPSDVVRKQLADIMEAKGIPGSPIPRFTAKEYSRIISELGNAEHRVGILMRGQTPTYDAAAHARVTDAFAKSKDDMVNWGAEKKGNAPVVDAWNKALTEYQEKIVPIANNPILQTSKQLDPRGHDLDKLLSEASNDRNNAYVRELLGAYKTRNMADAADRLDLLDANSVAAQFGGKGAFVDEALPHKMSDVMSLIGEAYSGVTNNPVMKGWYFGDPMLESAARGPLSTFARKSPIALGRESGKEVGAGLSAIYDIFGPTAEDVINQQDPQYSHGMGAATQAGAAGR